MDIQRQYRFHGGKNGAAISIHVTPRARKNAIIAINANGIVRIHLTSPPVDGKANRALINYLADVFGVKKTDIEIVAGHNGRDKIVTIINKSAVDIQKTLVLQMKQ
jgi:uncharacterized protein